jgi:hypothetical protein
MMFDELAVAAAFTITWRRINNQALTVHRRKAALVALVLNLRDADVLLEALCLIAARGPAGPALMALKEE